MDILEYLIATGSTVERFDFDTHEEAYEFGHKLRENISSEGYSDCIEVKISVTTVRVYVNESACLTS